jgi:DNA invertase Pin-like site-specific DNA recombinase
VSTKDGRQDTENQLIALREYCQKQGWQIAGEYVDHETGATPKRPQFQRMFADARERKFDLVLFWSLDRLSREGVSATLGHLERLTSYGWAGARTRKSAWTRAAFSVMRSWPYWP